MGFSFLFFSFFLLLFLVMVVVVGFVFFFLKPYEVTDACILRTSEDETGGTLGFAG